MEVANEIRVISKDLLQRSQNGDTLLSKGGILTYAKDNRTVIIMVGGNNDAAAMTVTVGVTGR